MWKQFSLGVLQKSCFVKVFLWRSPFRWQSSFATVLKKDSIVVFFSINSKIYWNSYSVKTPANGCFENFIGITSTSNMTQITFFICCLCVIHSEINSHWCCPVTVTSIIQTCSSSGTIANSSTVNTTIRPICPVGPYNC